MIVPFDSSVHRSVCYCDNPPQFTTAISLLNSPLQGGEESLMQHYKSKLYNYRFSPIPLITSPNGKRRYCFANPNGHSQPHLHRYPLYQQFRKIPSVFRNFRKAWAVLGKSPLWGRFRGGLPHKPSRHSPIHVQHITGRLAQ